MSEPKYVPYQDSSHQPSESLTRSTTFFQYMDSRRSVRDFSDRPVAREVIENIIMTASSAPSGAHKQPWTFCAISNAELKAEIRKAAEKEEYESYHGRMTEEWLEALAPLGTNWQKPFLEIAPWLIVLFKKAYDLTEGSKSKNYYVNESVGIAAGFLLTAIHHAGLVSLTHTPSPMNFLQKILKRPANERAFLLVPVGYPAKNAMVPDIKRKTKEEVLIYFD